MVNPIEPDRYANTGFSVRDTSPEVNEMIFRHVMSLTDGERLKRGLSMMATARKLLWSSIPKDLPPDERRYLFIERMYGKEYCDSVRGKLDFSNTRDPGP